MVTLKEIAARCHCSVATVSKALNGLPDISAATAELIRQTADQMGYLPNAAARTLKTSRSKTVGLLLFLRGESVFTHGYFAGIAQSIQTVMEQSGYDITPINCQRPGVMNSYRDYCRHRGYDGLIAMSAGFPEAQLAELADSEIPMVTIDYAFNHRGAVLADNEQGMRELLNHVYERGHRRIAMIYGDDTAVTRARLGSFYTTCEELDIPVPHEYVCEAIYHNWATTAQRTRELLALPQPPTCILFQDDYSAVGGLRTLREEGLRVPEDISITGYDGIPLAGYLYPRLTTFQQDSEAIGRHAARMLLRAMEKPRNFIPRHMRLPGRLLPGESVRNLLLS